MAQVRFARGAAAFVLVASLSLGYVGGMPVNVGGSQALAATSSKAAAVPTVEETVILDDAGVRVTVTGLENGLFGTDLKLVIENNAEVGLTVQCRNSSVNGYMVETMMSTDVAPGKKAGSKLTFQKSALQECGIETLADMEFSLHVFESDGWNAYLDTPQIQVKTSAFEGYEQPVDDEGDVLFEFDGIKIVLKGLDENASFVGPGVRFYIQNDSDRNVTVQVRDESVNGFMASGIMSCEVMAGKRAVDDIAFMKSQLEENGITTIESVELSFHIFETDGWETVVDSDPIEMTF